MSLRRLLAYLPSADHEESGGVIANVRTARRGLSDHIRGEVLQPVGAKVRHRCLTYDRASNRASLCKLVVFS